MKLFGGKKGDDKQSQGSDDEAGYYDSPQETVSLADARGSAPKGGAPAPKSGASATTATPPLRHDRHRKRRLRSSSNSSRPGAKSSMTRRTRVLTMESIRRSC